MQKPAASRPDLTLRHHRQQSVCLLLVGSEDAFKDPIAEKLFKRGNLQVVARSLCLLEAIACLDSGAIDIVLLSREFRKEELTLFKFDARRRGFAGLVLQLADTVEDASDTGSLDERPIQMGDFFMETVSRRVWLRGQELPCRTMEFDLLLFLCRHPNQLLSHRTVMECLWPRTPISRHLLRSLIHKVRAKIETTPEPRYIVTHRQLGYRFIPSPAPVAEGDELSPSCNVH